MIHYRREAKLSSEEFVDLLVRSTLAERRPVDDPARISQMVEFGNLTITARDDAGILVGIARCVTDFSYCCYVSDLAVDAAFQRQGIGRALLERVKSSIHEKAFMFLQAAPAAAEYYPHIGFSKVERMWRL
ncbi:MAG TPA: GNAT family N-acetyltransferase [Candidatus Cybelea sp.]|jgi:GNAT superfamily N-acetyltransferase|nr:GNAT family N-acetyltransferase [Candidatus Cybelea sp.]